MKKGIYILLLLPLLLISCEIETSGNGKLDGNWQLLSFDTLSTGGVCNMKESGIYWGVENHLLQVRNVDKEVKILFRFEKSENTLTVHSPHVFIGRYETVPVEDESMLEPFGIYGTEEVFAVERLSGSSMVLTNERLRLRFRKY
ncbi:MAG: lipocalin-like domain-containing protein [Prevotellaceae bacterium]|nr:lipocalin-like domain-containing protein [Prevotellaceae bacterium]